MFKQNLLIAIGALFGATAINAQVATPRVEMPFVDNAEVLERELSERYKGRPDMFAVQHTVDISPTNSGEWAQQDNNTSVWKIEISSPGALSLNFGFTKFDIPVGSELRMYQSENGVGFRPFTAKDVDTHGELWTPIIAGDLATIELMVPTDLIAQTSLTLTYVNHDFEGFGGLKPAGTSRSGSCNLDVVCTEADGWPQIEPYRDIINAVGAYTVGGVETCSGSLINNTANDGTPYFLTANHCGVNSGNAGSVVAYWNYQNEVCRQPNSPESGGNGSFPGPSVNNWDEFNSGAIFRATGSNGDFCLIEFDDELESSTTPYLAGWDRQEAAPDGVVGIHHPGVEEKRISFENDMCEVAQGNGGTPGGFIRVPDWDIGTTEPGSSGSPIFNLDGQIVGDLCCGGAACGNDLQDFYGRLAYNWEGGGTPSTRLKDWLDPMGLDPMSLDGLDAAFAVGQSVSGFNICSPAELTIDFTPSGAFEGDVTYTATGFPAGVMGTFSQATVAVGSTTTLTITGDLTQDFQVEVTGMDATGGTGTTSIPVDIEVAAPAAPSNLSPTNGDTELSLNTTLEWNGASDTFEVEIATDAAFTNIVGQQNSTSEMSFVPGNLDLNTVYFWRTRASNICGDGDWSEVFSFTTIVEENCTVTEYTGPGVTINGDQGELVFAVVAVPFTGQVDQVIVRNVSGTHSWIEDLTFSMRSPSFTTVVLMDQICDGEDNFDIGFSDFGSTDNPPCPPTDGELYVPMEALSAFNGQQAQGNWTMRVLDNANQDGGSLTGFELELCGDFADFVVEAELPQIKFFPNPANDFMQLQLLANVDGNSTVHILDAAGKIVLSEAINGRTSMQLNTSQLASGMYFLQVQSQNQYVSAQHKFVKQ